MRFSSLRWAPDLVRRFQCFESRLSSNLASLFHCPIRLQPRASSFFPAPSRQYSSEMNGYLSPDLQKIMEQSMLEIEKKYAFLHEQINQPAVTSSEYSKANKELRKLENSLELIKEVRAKRKTSLSKITEMDLPLKSLGFEYTHFSPEKVAGRLTVTESSCQPFKRMHGGVAALLAEGVASVGACIASSFRRIAGVQLSISYLSSAFIGDKVEVEATPIKLGKTIQVWEVHLWRVSPTLEEKELLSTSRVTLLCNLPSSEEMESFVTDVKKYAKL